MISQLNASVVQNAYTSNLGDVKGSAKKGSLAISKQGDLDKIDKIKASLESGQYKIDIEALSEKIAQELLQ